MGKVQLVVDLGTLFFANGEFYKGGFEQGRKTGQGVYIYSTGDRYDGEWKDDVFNGQGMFIYKTG